jgi:hypothetical protein
VYAWVIVDCWSFIANCSWTINTEKSTMNS